MLNGNLLLMLRQVDICVSLYGSSKLEAYEITPAQVFMLNEMFSIEQDKRLCASDLSVRMGFSRATVSSTLKQLRKKGYIQMDMDAADNRKKPIVLTPKAYSKKSVVVQYMDDLTKCLCKGVPKHDLECMEQTLKTFLVNVQQESTGRNDLC